MPRDTEDLQQRGDRGVGRAQPRALTAASARAACPARARPLPAPQTDIHTLRRKTQSQSPKRFLNVLNYPHSKSYINSTFHIIKKDNLLNNRITVFITRRT